MQLQTSRMLAMLLAYLAAETQASSLQGFPMYGQPAREYQDDDYYYGPKAQYYYDAPAVPAAEIYGHVPYPYINDPYGHVVKLPKDHEERLAALPVGQEVWYENQVPNWQNSNIDDVNAAFLDNLILTQMAEEAQKHRGTVPPPFPDYRTEKQRDIEDEDVRELKALAGKPLYHVPKTVPRFDDDDDYPSDEPEDSDSFINWNGNKRSVTTAAPATIKPKAGQKEVLLPGPGQTQKSRQQKLHNGPNRVFYETVAQLLANQKKNSNKQEQAKGRTLQKRFVSGDNDLVFELRGLKHRIAT